MKTSQCAGTTARTAGLLLGCGANDLRNSDSSASDVGGIFCLVEGEVQELERFLFFPMKSISLTGA